MTVVNLKAALYFCASSPIHKTFLKILCVELAGMLQASAANLTLSMPAGLQS